MPIYDSQNTDPAPTPGADEVRAELERVLSSRAFEQAGRASQFLRFVVDEALAGRADRLKGYAIAIAVFDRPEDFDAQADPVVRVEAGRLRRRLMEYYLSEGHGNEVRIELPRGGYVPHFCYATPAPRPAPVAQPEAAPPPPHGGRALAIAALVLPLLAFGVWYLSRPATDSVATAPTAAETSPVPAQPRPRLLVLPIGDLGDERDLALFARGLTDELLQAFVDFGIVEVASPANGVPAAASLSTLRDQFDAGYVLTGNVRRIDGNVRVAMRLIESETGTQLWARAFDEGLSVGATLTAQQTVAYAVGVILASPYGPIYAHEIARIADRTIDSLSPFECVVRFYDYVRTLGDTAHAEARSCLQRAIEVEPDYAEAWGGLAAIYLHEHTFGYNPIPDAPPPLERALEAARRSLDLDGSGRAVAVTLIGIRHAAGDVDGFERAIERALSISPPHPAILAHIGFLLTLSGEWQRGIPMLDQALPLTAYPPQWLYAAYAFRYLETHDYTAALDWALRIDTPNWFAAPMTVAAAAALAGRSELAEREIVRLLELYPSFASEGPAQLEKWRMEPALEDTILDGLERAGLALASRR
jgi:adenylate cyclase